jgi:uncharacterized protein (DUF2141 family)
MKNLTTVFAFLFCLTLSQAQEAKGNKLKVTIDNVLSDGGQIIAALHTAETFMTAKSVDYFMAEGKKGSVSFTFENVMPGDYAVMVMHDMNGNMQMDFDSNGMPKESYGMSGNEMVMGPPTFDAAKFKVGDSDQEIRIRF